MPAARRYPPIVSRRMCTAASMRRSDHPSRPSAMTCCFLSSLKTLLTLTEGIPHAWINVLDQPPIGRFSGDYHWPVLGDSRGFTHIMASGSSGRLTSRIPPVRLGSSSLSRLCFPECSKDLMMSS